MTDTATRTAPADSSFKREHRLKILRALDLRAREARAIGPDAEYLTIGELGDRVTGLDRHQVGRRIPELLRDYLVERGERRRCRVAGSTQHTHAITPKGRRALYAGGRR